MSGFKATVDPTMSIVDLQRATDHRLRTVGIDEMVEWYTLNSTIGVYECKYFVLRFCDKTKWSIFKNKY